MLIISNHVWKADKLWGKYEWEEVIARTRVRSIFIRGGYQQK